MDLDSLFDAPLPPPQPKVHFIEPLTTPTVPVPPFLTEDPVFVPQVIEPIVPEVPRPDPYLGAVQRIKEEELMVKVNSKKEQAFQLVQEKIVDASNPAIGTMINLLEAKKTIQTKDGDILEVPDPKIQFQAAKDILDRAGHQAKQNLDITSNGDSISDLYLQMMARRSQAITIEST